MVTQEDPREVLAACRSIAYKTGAPLHEHDDLVGAGLLGYYRALSHFDESKGIRLEAYCRVSARWAMLDYLRTLDILPRSARQEVKKREEELGILDETGRVMELRPEFEPVSYRIQVQIEAKVIVGQCLKYLPERERYIVYSIYWEEKPLTQLAEELNCTTGRVSQLRMKALSRIYEILKFKSVACLQ